MARYRTPTASRAVSASTSSVTTSRSKASPTRPASTAARGSRERIPPSCGRSRRPASPTASWRNSSAATTKANRKSPARPARTCSDILESRWTTSSTGPAWRTRRMAVQLVSHGPLHRQRCPGQHPQLPGVRYDIIDVRDNSLQHRAVHQIARETAGDRPIPSWLQVVGERQRVLVHQLPERAQIDMPLTEQLIVEFYSK